MRIERASVASVVAGAIHLAASAVRGSSGRPRRRRTGMAATPINGEKVVTESIISAERPQGVGKQTRYAQQDDEGVVIHIAGLKPSGRLADSVGYGRDPVGTQTVDKDLVSAFP